MPTQQKLEPPVKRPRIQRTDRPKYRQHKCKNSEGEGEGDVWMRVGNENHADFSYPFQLYLTMLMRPPGTSSTSPSCSSSSSTPLSTDLDSGQKNEEHSLIRHVGGGVCHCGSLWSTSSPEKGERLDFEPTTCVDLQTLLLDNNFLTHFAVCFCSAEVKSYLLQGKTPTTNPPGGKKQNRKSATSSLFVDWFLANDAALSLLLSFATSGIHQTKALQLIASLTVYTSIRSRFFSRECLNILLTHLQSSKDTKKQIYAAIALQNVISEGQTSWEPANTTPLENAQSSSASISFFAWSITNTYTHVTHEIEKLAQNLRSMASAEAPSSQPHEPPYPPGEQILGTDGESNMGEQRIQELCKEVWQAVIQGTKSGPQNLPSFSSLFSKTPKTPFGPRCDALFSLFSCLSGSPPFSFSPLSSPSPSPSPSSPFQEKLSCLLRKSEILLFLLRISWTLCTYNSVWRNAFRSTHLSPSLSSLSSLSPLLPPRLFSRLFALSNGVLGRIGGWGVVPQRKRGNKGSQEKGEGRKESGEIGGEGSKQAVPREEDQQKRGRKRTRVVVEETEDSETEEGKASKKQGGEGEKRTTRSNKEAPAREKRKRKQRTFGFKEEESERGEKPKEKSKEKGKEKEGEKEVKRGRRDQNIFSEQDYERFREILLAFKKRSGRLTMPLPGLLISRSFHDAPGMEAFAIRDNNDNFTVLKGSHVCVTGDPTLREGVKIARRKLEMGGVIVPSGSKQGYFVFNEDSTFSSSSTAACLVRLSNLSGNYFWHAITKTGKAALAQYLHGKIGDSELAVC